MKYSVGTCTYNAEHHLTNYIALISEIDYDDFEIIVVDDCSEDKTYLRLLDFAEKSNKNVRVFKHEANKGPGVARNTGLQYVKGEKIVFIDVDDEIDKDLFRILDNYSDYDIVYFDYYKKYSSKVCNACSTLLMQEGETEDINNILMTTNGSVWGKLFDTSIIKKNKVCFPNMLKSEDLVFLITYLSYCKKAYYLKQPLYYYTISSTSLVHRNIENQVKFAYRAIELINQLTINNDVKLLFYCREIVYDITIIYIRIGKGRKYVKEFWTEERLPHNWQRLKSKLRKSQYIFLYLIDHKCYNMLYFLVKAKSHIS